MFYQTSRTEAAERAENAFFVPGDLDLWSHSNSSERGTKHVFRMNLAQIRSAVSAKTTDWRRQKQNLT